MPSDRLVSRCSSVRLARALGGLPGRRAHPPARAGCRAGAAGAEQPARDLQHPQGDGEPAGRAEGAARRGGQGDRRRRRVRANVGEARRQLAKGMALLAGTPWTPALDYQNSLVIRSERTIVDSSEPYAARLEQIYRPAIELTPALTARVSLLKRAGREAGRGPAAAPPPMVTVRDFGRFDGVARDLRESPFPMELDLAGGAGRRLYARSRGLRRRHLARHRAARPRAAQGPRCAAARPRGRRRRRARGGARGHPLPGRLHPQRQPRARRAAARSTSPRSSARPRPCSPPRRRARIPFKGRTGDMERHYLLEGADEVMPYRVYVPTGVPRRRRRRRW